MLCLAQLGPTSFLQISTDIDPYCFDFGIWPLAPLLGNGATRPFCVSSLPGNTRCVSLLRCVPKSLPLHLSLLMDQEIRTAFESPQNESPNSYLQKDINVCMWCQNKISVCAIKKQLLLAACPDQSQQGARQVFWFYQTLGSLSNHPSVLPARQ